MSGMSKFRIPTILQCGQNLVYSTEEQNKISIQPKSDSSIGLTISLKDETAATEKWREGVMESLGEALWGTQRRRKMRFEMKWKMALFTKNALCQSWKRTDKGKRKKREKKEWNSERLKYGQPQSNRGISVYIKTNTAYLSPGINLYIQSNNTWLESSAPPTGWFLYSLACSHTDMTHPIMQWRWSCFSRIPIRFSSNTPKRTVCMWDWQGSGGVQYNNGM